MSAAAIPLTRAFAQFTAAAHRELLPEAVRTEAVRAIADCVGGALAGVDEPVTRIATMATNGGPCTLWGRPGRATVCDATLVNGCAAHAHAIDDTNESMRGHPSAPIVPAILALGEALDSGGHDLVTAYAVGVEIAAKLGRAVNDRHAQVGWHTTGTLGSVGAAAACARLLALDAEHTAHALGIAASMAGGLRVNFGTMTKPLHAALAARAGLEAAQWAARGMTASTQALEGHEGFLALYCGDGARPEAALDALGAPWELQAPGIVYKRYPTCSLMHALIDLVLDAHEQGVFTGREELHCAISARLQAARHAPWPGNGLSAKFHVEYCVATAALTGSQAIADFTDAAVQRAAIQQAARHVHLHVGVDFPAGNGDCAELAVLREGREVHRARRDKPRGHPSQPLRPEEHAAKFLACASGALGAQGAAALHAALLRLDEPLHAPSAREIARLATPSPSLSETLP